MLVTLFGTPNRNSSQLSPPMAMDLVAPRAASGDPLLPPSDDDSDDDDIPGLVVLSKERASAVAKHVSRVRVYGSVRKPAAPSTEQASRDFGKNGSVRGWPRGAIAHLLLCQSPPASDTVSAPRKVTALLHSSPP